MNDVSDQIDVIPPGEKFVAKDERNRTLNILEALVRVQQALSIISKTLPTREREAIDTLIVGIASDTDGILEGFRQETQGEPR